jgi:hypothetical protein
VISLEFSCFLPTCEDVSNKLHEIVVTMIDDEVTGIVRTDSLIVSYRERLWEMSNTTGISLVKKSENWVDFWSRLEKL